MDWLFDLLSSHLLPTWLFLLLALVLMAIPMGPAEPVAIIAATVVSASVLPLVPTVIVLAAGMVAGDLVAYRASGLLQSVISRRPATARRLDRWRGRLHAHPVSLGMAVVGLRFLPGARTPAALIARAAGVSGGRFVFLTVTGSSLWASAWVLAGSFLVGLSSPVVWVLVATAVTLTVVTCYMLQHGRPANPGEADIRVCGDDAGQQPAHHLRVATS